MQLFRSRSSPRPINAIRSGAVRTQRRSRNDAASYPLASLPPLKPVVLFSGQDTHAGCRQLPHADCGDRRGCHVASLRSITYYAFGIANGAKIDCWHQALTSSSSRLDNVKSAQNSTSPPRTPWNAPFMRRSPLRTGERFAARLKPARKSSIPLSAARRELKASAIS